MLDIEGATVWVATLDMKGGAGYISAHNSPYGAIQAHYDPGPSDDVDEVVSWKCPHGTEWTLHCKGCGAEVDNWGMGAAGFRDLCGCENQVSA